MKVGLSASGGISLRYLDICWIVLNVETSKEKFGYQLIKPAKMDKQLVSQGIEGLLRPIFPN